MGVYREGTGWRSESWIGRRPALPNGRPAHRWRHAARPGSWRAAPGDKCCACDLRGCSAKYGHAPDRQGPAKTGCGRFRTDRLAAAVGGLE